MSSRREFGSAIVACVAGAALVFLGLRQHWGRVYYKAPAPLPSGSLPVSGQSLVPAASALALAALACLAAVIATRGLARQVAGLVMAGLGSWTWGMLDASIGFGNLLSAASGQAGPGGLAGSVPGGNSAISGTTTSGGLPLIGSVSNVVWDGSTWRQVAVSGAVILIMMGAITVWRGQRWPVMSARFDRPGRRPDEAKTMEHGAAEGSATQSTAAAPSLLSPPQAAAAHAAAIAPATPPDSEPEGEAAVLWEALDRGEDLTEPAGAPRDEP